jgi:hypothetical protein
MSTCAPATEKEDTNKEDDSAGQTRSNGRPKGPWLSVGKHGWSIHFPPYREGSLSYGEGTLSHYGDTWREHLADLTPDALGTDTRTIPDEDIVRFTVSGPIGHVAVPDGHVSRFLSGIERWEDAPIVGRDPRFGNAGSLDRVALDVYVKILLRFGGRVFDPHREGCV